MDMEPIARRWCGPVPLLHDQANAIISACLRDLDGSLCGSCVHCFALTRRKGSSFQKEKKRQEEDKLVDDRNRKALRHLPSDDSFAAVQAWSFISELSYTGIG
jgi:hypothetical protein